MILLREIDLQKYTARLAYDLSTIPGFSVTKLFLMIDETRKNYLVEQNLKMFIKNELKVAISKAESESLFKRLDRDYDCKVTLHEFSQQFEVTDPSLLSNRES
jgi:Ca2+-binding EF-hand superfamily protein